MALGREGPAGPPPPDALTLPPKQEPVSIQPGSAAGSGYPLATDEATQGYFRVWPPPLPPQRQAGGTPARVDSARTARRRGPGRTTPPAPSQRRLSPRKEPHETNGDRSALTQRTPRTPAHPHRPASESAASSKQRPPLLAPGAPPPRALLGDGSPASPPQAVIGCLAHRGPVGTALSLSPTGPGVAEAMRGSVASRSLPGPEACRHCLRRTWARGASRGGDTGC